MARMVCEAAIQALIRSALRALGIPGQLQPFRNGQRDVEIVPSHASVFDKLKLQLPKGDILRISIDNDVDDRTRDGRFSGGYQGRRQMRSLMETRTQR
jgi:hypothetical protein